MAIFLQDHTTTDAQFPASVITSGVTQCVNADSSYIVSGLAKNHADAFTPAPFYIADNYAENYIYSRIWARPLFTALGFLPAERTVDCSLWNAYATDVTLTAITEDKTTGLTLSGITAPLVMNGYSDDVFTVTLGLSGNSTIDATYTFVTSSGSPAINFTGQRLIPFTLRPQIPVKERWEWITTILTSYDTSEQRIMLRDNPRRVMVHNYQANTALESSTLTNVMLGGLGNFFTVPSWHEQKMLEFPVSVGSSLIFVDTRFADFQVGWKAMLWKDSTTYEIINVDAINVDYLELGTPITTAFGEGTLVLPVHFGVIKDKIQHSTNLVSLSKAQVEFILADTSIPDTTTYVPDVEYLSYEVLIKLNYTFSGASAQQDVLRPMVFFDNGQGKFEVENKSHAKLNNTLGFACNDLSSAWDIKTFMATLKGRLKPFWALTWTKDFFIEGTYSNIDTYLNIAPSAYYLFFSDSTYRKNIVFVMNNGDFYYRSIVTATETSITIDSTLGIEFSESDIKMVCFMNLVRCASDDVNFEWTQAGHVQISVPVVGVDA